MSEQNDGLLNNIHTLLINLSEKVAVVTNIVEGIQGDHNEIKIEFKEYREKTDKKIEEQGKRTTRVETKMAVEAASWKSRKTLINLILTTITVLVGALSLYEKYGG